MNEGAAARAVATGRMRWRHRWLAACAAAWTVLAGGAEAEAKPETVVLLAAPGVRLADELARELAVSSMTVERIAVAARMSETEALEAVPEAQTQGVFVAPDERGMTVFARAAGSGLDTRIELRVNAHDRVARRRACLTVVEYLRVSTANGASAPPAEARSTGTARGSTGSAAGSSPAAGVKDEPAPPAVLAAGTGQATGYRRPWIMGVATTLDLNTALGQSTAHLSFIWHFPLRPRLALRLIAQWPLLGAQFDTDEGHVRLWTFGGAVGVHYSFVPAPAIVRPFVGVTLGTRLTLIEASSAVLPNTTPGFTPSLGAGVQVGLAYQVARLVQLFVESGATRDWLVPTLDRKGTAHDAASALSLNSSVGVMIEY